MESTSIHSSNNSRENEEIQIIINQSDDEIENVSNNHNIINCLKKSMIILISIVSFLIISIDLYIAFTYNSCINKYMKIYLIISSIFILSLLLIYVFNKNIVKIIISNRNLLFFSIYTYTFIIIGYILCTILGSIIYWDVIDKNKCLSFVNNYLYTILIIKIIYAFYLLYNKFLLV